MAVINTYRNIPHNTYANWKLATTGNSYIVDSNQELCWNYITELWYNVGFPQGYPLMGISDFPAEIWILNKEANTSYNGTHYFDLVYNVTDIKKGDVLVFSGLYNDSHIGVADEDYTSSHSSYIRLLSQGVQGSQYVSLENYPLTYFLGGFRYIRWNNTPPTPPTPPSTTAKKRFNWVLFNKRRNML